MRNIFVDNEYALDIYYKLDYNSLTIIAANIAKDKLSKNIFNCDINQVLTDKNGKIFIVKENESGDEEFYTKNCFAKKVSPGYWKIILSNDIIADAKTTNINLGVEQP